MRYLPVIVPILLLIALPVFGASSFLSGFSGNILTPDSVIETTGTWEASYHQAVNLLGDNDNLTTFGVIYGATPNLELGASFVDNGESDTTLNAKYRLLAETADRPAIIVGVFDAAGSADFLDDNAGFYLALSKNVTPTASEIAGGPSKPLRLTLGVGSGVFNGLFAGFDWTLEPKLSLMAEFFNGSLGGNDSFFNAGIRYAATDALRLDAATIDFRDLAFGASYRIAF